MKWMNIHQQVFGLGDFCLMILDTSVCQSIANLFLLYHMSLAKPILACVQPLCHVLTSACFLTPGFCLNPDCTSAVPNTACLFITTFACLTPDFHLSPACAFARIFWTCGLRLACTAFLLFWIVVKIPNYYSAPESTSGSTVCSGLTGLDSSVSHIFLKVCFKNGLML